MGQVACSHFHMLFGQSPQDSLAFQGEKISPKTKTLDFFLIWPLKRLDFRFCQWQKMIQIKLPSETCKNDRQNSLFFHVFIFKYILLIMLLQLSHFFSPLSPSAMYPAPSSIHHPYFMSMGHIYEFFGFSISYTLLNLLLSSLYLPISALNVYRETGKVTNL